MSLRARLALIVGLVLTCIMIIVGGIVVQTSRATLQDQVDDQLLETALKIKPSYGDERTDQPEGEATAATGTPGPAEPPRFRAVARYVIGPDGTVLSETPHGFSDTPKSPPQLPEIPSESVYEELGEITTVPSEDGSLNYRMMIQLDENDNFVVTAAPLEDAESALDRLIRTMALAGLAGVLLAALASWAVISRELRPIDRMIDTAAEIGEGHLSQRVPEVAPGTELGRLGSALNRMLGRVEASAEAQSRSESRLRQFVADAAHELRTPLTSVRGYAELYRQGALDSPERVRQAMRRIEGEGTRMGTLLDEMLLLARLDQQVEHIHEPVDFSAIVDDSVDAFQAIQPNRPVELSLTEHLMVDGVALHLRQIADNLMTNIRIHTPADAPVIVTLEHVDEMARLQVRDEGPGINPEFMPQIFERFTREDPARTRATGGSGLGLAIVAALVEAHGGTIQVESEPGEGTAFIVRLPTITSADPADDQVGS